MEQKGYKDCIGYYLVFFKKNTAGNNNATIRKRRIFVIFLQVEFQSILILNPFFANQCLESPLLNPLIEFQNQTLAIREKSQVDHFLKKFYQLYTHRGRLVVINSLFLLKNDHLFFSELFLSKKNSECSASEKLRNC